MRNNYTDALAYILCYKSTIYYQPLLYVVL